MFEHISPLTANMVVQRWHIDYLQLRILNLEHGLIRDSESEIRLMGISVDHDNIRTALFRIEDVKEFEEKYPELLEGPEERRFRKDQRHKERCRAIAEVLWDKKPTMTIAAMAKTDEINKIGCEGKIYTVETIRKWIKKVCPNRNPGRRPKEG